MSIKQSQRLLLVCVGVCILGSILPTPAHGAANICAQALKPTLVSDTDFSFDAKWLLKNEAARKEIKVPVRRVVQLPKYDELYNVALEITTLLETNYGPRILKRASAGVSWNKVKQKFLGSIEFMRTETDLAYGIASFLAGFNDAHISNQLPSSLTWKLPIQASYTEVLDPATNKMVGKWEVNYMERENLQKQLVSGELPPLKAELVAVDGASLEEMRLKIPQLNSAGNDLTNKSFLGRKIFRMSEASGLPLSRMKNEGTEFTFRWKDKDGKVVEKVAKLKYVEEGDGITAIGLRARPMSPGMEDMLKAVAQQQQQQPSQPSTNLLSLQAKLIDKLFNTSAMAGSGAMPGKAKESVLKIPKNPAAEGVNLSIGQRKPLFALPKDFQEIVLPEWITKNFSAENIFAGTFVDAKGKRVGLLRIPSYDVEDVMGATVMMQYLVRRLEASTDYLIIDQMHNPGGSVTYSDFWVKAFVGNFDRTKHLAFRVKPTDHFLRSFLEIRTSFDQASRMLPNAIRKDIMDDMEQQFKVVQLAYETKSDLSRPISLLPFARYFEAMAMLQEGMTMMQEKTETGVAAQRDIFEGMRDHEPGVWKTYTKKIVMIVDQFCFSGGDATPASLRDYQRVVLIGNRTAGAGGTVEEFTVRLMGLQFTFHMTTSLMYRMGQKVKHYIENFGVKVDHELPFSSQDYADGGQGYLNRVLDLIYGKKLLETPIRPQE